MASSDSGAADAPAPAGAPGRARPQQGQVGRWVTLAGGAALMVAGLARRSLAGGALVLIGSGLVYRGVVTAQSRVQGAVRVLVRKTITIDRPVETLYRFWRNFDNLPRFMKHLAMAQPIGRRRSHWVATAPLGATVSWDAEIVEERENERIAWQSLPGADVPNSGVVEFTPAPDGHGTQVTVTLEYEPPAGDIGAAVAKLFGEEPQQQVEDDLQRLKALMEAEAVTPADEVGT